MARGSLHYCLTARKNDGRSAKTREPSGQAQWGNIGMRTMTHCSYAPVLNWLRWPEGWNIAEVTAVATDSRDRVFVFGRGNHPVTVFECGGGFLFAWGEQQFVRPHGITIGPDDAVWCVDDLDHTVRKY